MTKPDQKSTLVEGNFTSYPPRVFVDVKFPRAMHDCLEYTCTSIPIGPPKKEYLSITEHSDLIAAARYECMAQAFEIAAALEQPYTIESFRSKLRRLASEQRDAAKASIKEAKP